MQLSALSDETIGGIAMLLWYVLFSCGAFVCLRKAERNAWHGFVPVLNGIQLLRLVGLSGWWALAVFVPIANLLLPFYMGLKLAQRFNASDGMGVLLGFSGLSLLPLLALDRWPYLVQLESPEEFDDLEFIDCDSHKASPYDAPRYASASQVESSSAVRSSRIRMIVLSIFYGFGLLCIPGLMIIGTMAFGGATQQQIDNAGLVAGLFCLTPISLLIALIGGWILHVRRRYAAASSLVVLPILNGLAVCASFVWVLS